MNIVFNFRLLIKYCIKKNLKSKQLSKKCSTFFVSLKWRRYKTFEQLIFKKLGYDKFPNISVNFEGKKLVDHSLEIPRLEVFDVKCFYCEITKLYFSKWSCMVQRRYRSRHLIIIFIGIPCTERTIYHILDYLQALQTK